MKTFELEVMDKKQLEHLCSKFPEGNKYICETAGFIPLDVKFKQYEQNGMIASFLASDFTSSDYREMYMNPDFEIYPEDDLEDINEKRIALYNHIEEVKKKIAERKTKEKEENKEKKVNKEEENKE